MTDERDDEVRDDEPVEADSEPTPEEFEEDPSRNPDDDRLKEVKGG